MEGTRLPKLDIKRYFLIGSIFIPPMCISFSWAGTTLIRLTEQKRMWLDGKHRSYFLLLVLLSFVCSCIFLFLFCSGCNPDCCNQSKSAQHQNIHNPTLWLFRSLADFSGLSTVSIVVRQAKSETLFFSFCPPCMVYANFVLAKCFNRNFTSSQPVSANCPHVLSCVTKL